MRHRAACLILLLSSLPTQRLLARGANRNADPAASAATVAAPLMPEWQASLGEPLRLPVAIDNRAGIVVSTASNRIVLVHNGKIVWQMPVDTALMATPALFLADSNLATVLRDGTFEVRSPADGSAMRRSHLPLSHCETGAIVGQHTDGTLSIACGQRIARVDSTGRVLFAATPANGHAITLLHSDLVATAGGGWFLQRRWRDGSLLFGFDYRPLQVAAWQLGFPWRVLLDDSRVIRVEDDMSWAFESLRSDAVSSSIVAIAPLPHGDWVSLDAEGTIARHSEHRSIPIGEIGPMAAMRQPLPSAGVRPRLVACASGDVVAGWPTRDLVWLRADATRILGESGYSGQLQVRAEPPNRLLVASEDGTLRQFLLR